MIVNDRVNRREDRGTIGATVLAIDGDIVLIAYDEGGEGWWSAEELDPAD